MDLPARGTACRAALLLAHSARFALDLYAFPRPTLPHTREVLSPSTEAIDRGEKLRIYARESVAHAWLIDPSRRTLEVLTLGSLWI